MAVRRRPRKVRAEAGALGGSSVQRERLMREAANAGEVATVRRWLERGVRPDAADGLGRTALHFCATKGDVGLLELLVEHGADLNVRDGRGNTPLHLAACTNHASRLPRPRGQPRPHLRRPRPQIEFITALLDQRRCDPTLKDGRGLTPLHYAQSHLQMLNRSGGGGEAHSARVAQVAAMLASCLRRVGGRERALEVERVASGLSAATTDDDVNSIAALLEGFASLSVGELA